MQDRHHCKRTTSGMIANKRAQGCVSPAGSPLALLDTPTPAGPHPVAAAAAARRCAP